MTKMLIKPELLAPAGNFEKLKWAIKYGADAVYIGGRNYGLRANNDNFSLEEIKEACDYAHARNVKIYVTVNIVFHNEDVKSLKEYLIELGKCKVDAIIVSDPFVINIAKYLIPEVEIHISTQASTINYEAVSFYKDEGASRVVLGREVSGSDIKEIIDKTGMDIEVFIHGAMCSGYSGRCVLSNYFTLRDSNRGGCSQVCRWTFNLQDKDKKDIESDSLYSISPKDLSMLKHIPTLINMGVKSFKIEGRMRSIYYIGTLLHLYRKVIDNYCNNPDEYEYNINYENILYRCANRDTIPQFFDRKPGVDEQYYIGRDEVSNQDFLGIVLDYDEQLKEVTIEQRNFFKVGDNVEIFGPDIDCYKFNIKSIRNEKNEYVDAARHPQEIIKIPLDIKVSKDDMLRVNIS